VKSLVVKGVPPYDGEYPLDFSSGLSNGELHKIKEFTGIRAGEMTAAMAAGDSDLTVAFAWILLTRAGHTVNIDALWAAPPDAFDVAGEDDPEEDEVRPPDSPTPGGEPSSAADVGSET
jgi:hypothetical protein